MYKESEDYYFEGELMVLTEAYLMKRGFCCGNGCRHCPYEYQNVENQSLKKLLNEKQKTANKQDATSEKY